MKIMAIDYGDARTGIAVSDAMGMLVGSTTVIHSRKPEATAEQIGKLVCETGAQRLVLGFPKNMDGSDSLRAELYRGFGELLRQVTGMEPVLWDERRTTIEAHQILSEGNYHGKKRKNTVDAVAASLILEGYLSYLRLHGDENDV